MKTIAFNSRMVRLSTVVLLALLPMLGQNTANEQLDSGSKMMNSSDMNFAVHAAQGGVAEVKLGQLAVEKAASADVKAFGQRMMDDHTKLNDQLKSVAAQQNITLPADMDGKDAAEYRKLSQLSGEAFDKAYMKDMVKDHKEDIKAFQKEANSGKDPQLKQFASTALPILQSHLQNAESVESKAGI